MSTRATYEIDGHSFYIHYDGYEAGAAVYFAAALACPNTRGGFSHQFLRANDLCELTGGHDSHGDTEYQYTYTSRTDTLTVKHRTTCAERKFVPIFGGSMADFLNKHATDVGANVWVQAFGSTMTEDAASKRTWDAINAIYGQIGRAAIGNANGAFADLKRGAGVVAGRFASEFAKIEAKLTAASAA